MRNQAEDAGNSCFSTPGIPLQYNEISHIVLAFSLIRKEILLALAAFPNLRVAESCFNSAAHPPPSDSSKESGFANRIVNALFNIFNNR